MVDDWVTELDQDDIESLYDEWIIDDDDLQELHDDWYIDWSILETNKNDTYYNYDTEYVDNHSPTGWKKKAQKEWWWDIDVISTFSRENLVFLPFKLIWNLLIIVVAIWLEIVWVWFLFWSVIWVVLVLIFAPWLFWLPLTLFWFLTDLRPD